MGGKTWVALSAHAPVVEQSNVGINVYKHAPFVEQSNVGINVYKQAPVVEQSNVGGSHVYKHVYCISEASTLFSIGRSFTLYRSI